MLSVRVRSGWMTFSVQELRADSLTVVLMDSEHTTVTILKMLESLVPVTVSCNNIVVHSTFNDHLN